MSDKKDNIYFKESPSGALSLLALGDSYTKGEAVTWQQNWPHQLIEELKAKGIIFEQLRIIAETGWRTDELLHKIKILKPAKAHWVSLLIGVNNQYQGKPLFQFEQEFEALLQIATDLAFGHKDHVFVLSIPDYGHTPFGKERQAEISAQIDLFNTSKYRICKEHGITFIDITEITRHGLQDTSLVASDGLHPSAKAYRLIAAQIAQSLPIKLP